jgi:hypothetical protein
MGMFGIIIMVIENELSSAGVYTKVLPQRWYQTLHLPQFGQVSFQPNSDASWSWKRISSSRAYTYRPLPKISIHNRYEVGAWLLMIELKVEWRGQSQLQLQGMNLRP